MVYDGDGNRVKATIGSTTTAYLGNYFEWTGSTSTLIKYFYAGAQRVAMKKGSTVYYLFGDHLGSTAFSTDSSGTKIGELRYKPWGENRYTWGTTYTNRHFTGQLDETTSIGLYFFNARFYDPLLARFTSADSLIPDPGNPQAWDRYAFTLNNPVKYIDPSGHRTCTEKQAASGDETCFNQEDAKNYMFSQYGWSITGEWSNEELTNIFATGLAIRNNIDSFTNGAGLDWMNKYIGNITIVKHSIFGKSYTFDENVHLAKNWITDLYPKELFAHELGHVWDDRTGTTNCKATWCGSGVGDSLAGYIGAGLHYPRFIYKVSGIDEAYEWIVRDGYGNHSTADYLGEAFGWAIFQPENIPKHDIYVFIRAKILLQVQP